MPCYEMKDVDRESAGLMDEPAEGGGIIEGGYILVPEGEYELRYSYYATAAYFGSFKVVVHCAIDAPDEYAGVEVSRFYNVKKVIPPLGKYGEYVASPCGALTREYKKLLGDPKRMTRISFTALKRRRLLGRLETVTHGHNRAKLGPDNQYSKIAELLGVIPDDDWT